MSGRSPGEVRLSAITLAELRFGIENGEFRSENENILSGLLEFLQVDDFPGGAMLVTNNGRGFRRVPGLSVQNWLRP